MISNIKIAMVVAMALATTAKKIIHLCPHSHDDVGWLKTLDQYFDGSQKQIQWTSVNDTIDTVVDSLLQNPKRRFVQVEMKFFSMWFYTQPEERKNQVRGLVKSGQMEIASAGWSMHDEACPTYEDMINNHMIGHEFVLKEFGVKPRVGWQIDPFGHSNTNARLFADMGFDAWFFGRMDWADYDNRIKNKELEWVWMPNGDKSKKIFTHKMWESYVWMPLFSFDIKYNNAPWINNKQSVSYNADELADIFIKGMQDKIAAYKTDHIFQPWGDDFAYINGFGDYTNLDKMIDFINEKYKDEYEIRYSTPSEYIDAIAAEEVAWPTKYDDLFPYSDFVDAEVKSAFWTGYFTSKANLKGQIRQTSSYTHAANALFTERVLAQDSSTTEIKKQMISKYVLLDAMGINQHHDAVTGTAKAAVAHDYAYILSRATDFTEGLYSEIIANKVRDATGHQVANDKWMQCKQTNLTYLDCPVALVADDGKEQFSMAVSVHNPSSQNMRSFQINVPKGQYKVSKFDSEKEFVEVKSNIACYSDLDEELKEVENCILDVYSGVIAPKEISLFKVSRVSKEMAERVEQTEYIKAEGTATTVKFIETNNDIGALKFEIWNEEEALNETLEISLKFWEGKANFNTWKNVQNSGAYIFVPTYDQFQALPYTSLISKTKIAEDTFIFTLGKPNDEEVMANMANVTVKFDSCVSNKTFFKVDVDLFGLPQAPYGGHEVVVEFKSDSIDNEQVFYTDANGLDM